MPSADGCAINHGLSFERGLASILALNRMKTRIIIIIIITLMFFPHPSIGLLPPALQSILLA